MREETIPQKKWKIGSDSAEGSYGMGFKSLDASFSEVGAVLTRGAVLEDNICGAKVGLDGS